jgi:hypothetical protein
MPQFDFYSFSGQVFWTLLGFFIFYFFVLRFYLTSFSEMFKMRQKLLTAYRNEKQISSTSVNPFLPFLAIIFKKVNITNN